MGLAAASAFRLLAARAPAPAELGVAARRRRRARAGRAARSRASRVPERSSRPLRRRLVFDTCAAHVSLCASICASSSRRAVSFPARRSSAKSASVSEASSTWCRYVGSTARVNSTETSSEEGGIERDMAALEEGTRRGARALASPTGGPGTRGVLARAPTSRPLKKKTRARALRSDPRLGGDLAGKAGATRGGAGDASSPSREPSAFVTRGRGVAGLSAARRAGRWRHARHAVLT